METKLKRNLCILICVMVTLCALPAMADAKKVNINTAPKKQLITLKYVGDALADRIIEFRNSTPFINIEDIMKVKGVGPKAFEANKDQISVKD
ncbi:helix-hairpin-helix domain-containing protein [Desulfobacter hydrogenophilus]|uniref:Helix-hairpin-helix domain-containing protein n=1 Tax=Desulfobacter hydrogenophilus TaxID=2291 RepID=A0A328F889_9BACT|nr:helix-hairpin-helix domain-containing protein [Desulfobacter hydrogenophilus]NDY74559.1 helix-hairpin-helix domain-containing protein [Desulfobacter hydrogenophilus]QBH15429.1 helix-hairpin-helix domain-containing protein [Desulfobacter hydrogenophilus]RAL99869.1 helix-hairpin-helix domain-containing protein [Desulfobacter hydrogenophilus]